MRCRGVIYTCATFAIFAAACGGTRPRDASPARTPTPVRDSDDRARDVEPERTAEPCHREWPQDPDDPRVGIYVFERALREPYSEDEVPGFYEGFYRFDGRTLTVRLASAYTHRPECTYGWPTDVPHMSLVQMHAHVTEAGWLYALMPCYGWERFGRFVDDGYIETQRGNRLRRLPVGDHDALEAPGWRDEWVAELFSCRETYEVPGEALPALPADAARR